MKLQDLALLSWSWGTILLKVAPATIAAVAGLCGQLFTVSNTVYALCNTFVLSDSSDNVHRSS